MDNNQIEAVRAEIEAIRQRINNGDYKDPVEKHELEKQRWLLKKHLDTIAEIPACAASPILNQPCVRKAEV